MINKKKLGEHIQKNRKKLKLTQNDLAEAIGLSRNYISDMENGRYAPSLESLYKIASLLNIDLNLFKMTEIQVIGDNEHAQSSN